MITASLAALLAHPTSRHIELLTPGVGDRAVNGVRLVRDLTARPEEAAGAALLVLDDVPRTDWRLDALLSRAHAAGAAVVILPGHEALRTPTALLATRFALPVVGANDPLAAFEAITNLLSGTSAEVSRIVLATEQACRRAGPDARDVVGAVTDTLGRDLALLDHAGRAVLGPELLDDPSRAQLSQHLGARPGSVTQSQVIDDLAGGELIVLRVSPTQTSWLCAHLPEPLAVEREAFAAALPIAAGAIRERLAQRRLHLERSARTRTSALAEITRPPYEASATARRRALDLGWQLEGWHVGVYVGVLGDLDLMSARTDLLNAFTAESLQVEAVEQAEGWAVWSTTAGEPSAADAVQHAESVRRAQRRLEAREVAATYVGVGRARPGAEGIANSLTEARDAARLARSREETGRFLHVDRLGFGQLLLGWTRTDSFRPAAEAILEPLSNAPGQLIGTLGAYLDCESSLAHTAAVLGVHRNTVSARIAKVQELLGVDLGNPDERLALHLACKTLALPQQTVRNR